MLALGSVVVAMSLGLSAVAVDAAPGSAATAESSSRASAIADIVKTAMKTDHLRAVIVKVTKGNQVVTKQAFGPSLTGEPATTDMYFRNGAVAFEYLTTLLMEFVDEHKVRLDDTIQRWQPKLPDADKVTLKMLANQTSGYPDFETDDAWTNAFNADPFRSQSYQSRLDYAFRRPMQFEPGTNWSYAHTNFMILGVILSQIGKKPLQTLLQQKVLKPMGLRHTFYSETASIPSPVLHSYDSERRPAFDLPPTVPFYEESTYFNSDWGVPPGANQTTNIDDMITTAVAFGTGKLVSKASYKAMTDPNLLEFGQKQANCEPSCFTQIPAYNYGLGVVRQGSWLVQDPLVGGYSATEAYLPSQKIAIAVATTFGPEAFNSEGVEANSSGTVFQSIAAYVAPNDAVPPPP
jgi:CubicO group peptidase (beta-lactamase class C family)